MFFVVGDSIRQPGAKGDEDISPYATFHLLGMREENKGAAAAAGQQNFQTMPPQQMMQQGPQGQQQMQQQQGPISPRHAAQTMNVSADFPLCKRWQKWHYHLFNLQQQQQNLPAVATIRCRSCGTMPKVIVVYLTLV